MTKVTLLYHPSEGEELPLITDCSNCFVGGVLHEVSMDGPKPLAFFSCKLSPAHCNYSHMSGNY